MKETAQISVEYELENQPCYKGFFYKTQRDYFLIIENKIAFMKLKARLHVEPVSK